MIIAVMFIALFLAFLAFAYVEIRSNARTYLQLITEKDFILSMDMCGINDLWLFANDILSSPVFTKLPIESQRYILNYAIISMYQLHIVTKLHVSEISFHAYSDKPDSDKLVNIKKELGII